MTSSKAIFSLPLRISSKRASKKHPISFPFKIYMKYAELRFHGPFNVSPFSKNYILSQDYSLLRRWENNFSESNFAETFPMILNQPMLCCLVFHNQDSFILMQQGGREAKSYGSLKDVDTIHSSCSTWRKGREDLLERKIVTGPFIISDRAIVSLETRLSKGTNFGMTTNDLVRGTSFGGVRVNQKGLTNPQKQFILLSMTYRAQS